MKTLSIPCAPEEVLMCTITASLNVCGYAPYFSPETIEVNEVEKRLAQRLLCNTNLSVAPMSNSMKTKVAC